jgi:hypothetical protein
MNNTFPSLHCRIGCLFALMIFSIAGCGDGKQSTQRVTGKVIFKGSGKPLDRGTIMLESVADPSIQASGDIQPDGTFELYCTLDKQGAVEGDHRVLIEQPLLETGERPVVQKKYRAFATSGLTATVKPGDNELNIELDPVR